MARIFFYNGTGAPLFIARAEGVPMIVLAEGTENTLTDGNEYIYASAGEDEPNAALFSKADLTITGTGALTVEGNYNDAITSKDGLLIHSGAIVVTAVDDDICGKITLLLRVERLR